MELSLTKLKNGESGTITSIKVGGRPGRGRRIGFVKRLTDMGLTPGIEITVVKSAPFKGPIELLVRGSRLVLGRGVATRIFVEVYR